MHDVIDKSIPLLRAANKHGVPKSTLHDRISGKVKYGDKPGPISWLRKMNLLSF